MTATSKARRRRARQAKIQAHLAQPKYQNRLGPDGIKLDPDEANSYFPELNVAPVPQSPERIAKDSHVGVAYGEINIILRDIEVSQEPGWFFGEIVDYLPENDQYLQQGQCIGFRAENAYTALVRE